ncbi:MAG: DNA polymerase III subunit beta [Rubrivivax sp.]|nr:DNA polymerase III subunit beta [Rubrivivax sp.]
MKNDTALLSGPRDALLQAAQTVLGIVERRHTLPILNHLLIRGDADGVQLTASDPECQLSTRAALVAEGGPFGITVAAHKLADILRALPPGATVRLARTRGRGSVSVSLHSGRSRFTLQTLPADDFPVVRTAEAAVRLQLPQATLLSLLDRVAFAMASHDIRYYLNGVLIVAEQAQLTAVATDGNRLALAQAALPSADADTDADADVDADADADFGKAVSKAVGKAAGKEADENSTRERLEFILPRKTVLELQRLLRGTAGGVLQLALSSAQAVFDLGGIRFVSKLIEGRFPDYRRVVPAAPPHSVLLNGTLLRAALERAALLTSDKFRGVRLLLQPGLLQISASNAAHEEALEEMAVDYAGPTMEIGLNVGYLIDLLASNNGSHDGNNSSVQMALRDAQSSLLFTRPADPGFSYVVSPMRI